MEIKRQQLLLRCTTSQADESMRDAIQSAVVAALGTSWTYVAYQVLQLHNIAELIERTILRDGFFCFMSQLLFNL